MLKFSYVLHPRTTGLTFLTTQLKQRMLESVFGCTIILNDNFNSVASTLGQVLSMSLCLCASMHVFVYLSVYVFISVFVSVPVFVSV